MENIDGVGRKSTWIEAVEEKALHELGFSSSGIAEKDDFDISSFRVLIHFFFALYSKNKSKVYFIDIRITLVIKGYADRPALVKREHLCY